MKILLHPKANLAFADTVRYYLTKSSEIAEIFIDEFEQSLGEIEKFPEAWPAVEKNIRKHRVKNFPYAIYYTFDGEEFLVYAVCHLMRKEVP